MEDRGGASVETLTAITDAFNAHDLDAIMEFFADDCELFMPRGPGPEGSRRFGGKAAVREGLAGRFAGVCRTFTMATTGIGSAAIGACPSGCSPAPPPMAGRFVSAVRSWEFRDGQVVRKDSYWKIVDPPA